jgi:hypothetical protein
MCRGEQRRNLGLDTRTTDLVAKSDRVGDMPGRRQAAYVVSQSGGKWQTWSVCSYMRKSGLRRGIAARRRAVETRSQPEPAAR